MNKIHDLAAISTEIEKCRTCKKDSSGKAVPGEGNPDAKIVFLGEAPGRTEAATGRPFIGRSGKFLRRLIRASGFQESEVYITSPVKYLPDAGTPTRDQINHGKKHLLEQLNIIQPDIIVLLGRTAVSAILDRPSAILQEHGKIIKQNGRTFMITLHPAAVIRFPKYADLIEQDFEKIAGMIQYKK